MLGFITQGLEFATSILHLVSLSMFIARLVANDPLGAIVITVVAGLCFVFLTGLVIVGEIAKWKVRRYVLERESEEQQRRRHLEDKSE
jgi:hypothetical protein